MNTHSVIATYIANHPDTWQAELEEKNIRVKTDGALAIFNYGTDCNFSDPVVQEARGIILDMNTLDVACWPFRKFGNWNEEYADDIDWGTARVQEKLDGSIVKLWLNHKTDTWQFSTNSVIDANMAPLSRPSESLQTYGDLIRAADNYDAIDFDQFDHNKTYIFELTSPMNQVVVPQHCIHLWHIGTRNNLTGQEYRENIGIDQPKEYPITSFKECLNAAKALNADSNGIIRQEGFVVVDDNWNRIKVKSPEYLSIHYLLGNGMMSKDRALDIIGQGLQSEVEKYPQVNVVLKWYEYQIADFTYKIAQYIAYVRGLYDEVEHNRKAVAMAIKNDPLSSFGFSAIGNAMSAQELIARMQRHVWAKYLKEYPPDIGEKL